MAGETHLVWTCLYLMSVLLASDSRHVKVSVTESITEDHFFSRIPSLDDLSCDAANQQILSLHGKLQQTSLHNNQLNEEAFGLRSDVRLLKLQLDACSLTASANTGSFQTHLHIKMKQLLDMFDNDTFQVLKIMTLTKEVNALQKKVNLAANSTESMAQHRELQRELQEKTSELNIKTQQLFERNPESTLILQIISLQNQIWDLHQSESKRRGSVLQLDRGVLVSSEQEELDRKLNELRSKGDKVNSDLLQLISVSTKTAAMQKMISVHIKEAGSHGADIQRQRRQKAELLKKKILQLNRDENNSDLTKEILLLQGEILHLEQLMLDEKKSSDSLLEELKTRVEEMKKQQVALEKQLEGADYVQAQLIIKILHIMEEIRELHQTTSTGEANNIWTRLKDKEGEFAKAQSEINDLQEKLQQLTKLCLRPEERSKQVRLQIEHKVAELNQTGDSEASLILHVINLLDEVKALKEHISTSGDQDKITELQLHLERKEKELNTRSEEVERLSSTPGAILQAIVLINQIWELQKQPVNETGRDRTEELRNRLDGLFGELDDREDKDVKLMLKALLLQSEVELLQRRLSDPELTIKSSQVTTELRNELQARRKELEKYISEMNDNNQTTIKLILNVVHLQKELRELDGHKQTKNQTATVTITQLKEQLKVKENQHAQQQAAIKALQDKLNQTEARCSDSDQKVQDLQTQLDGKLKELESKSSSQTSLAFQIFELTDRLEELKRQQENADSKLKAEDLQKLIDEKNKELAKKTAELKERSPQAQILLQIINKQVEIEDLARVASNDTDYHTLAVLQYHLKELINGIRDENTKLSFQIVAQKNEIETLNKQEDIQERAHAQEIKDLENELEDTRTQIEEKTVLLDSSDLRIANLTAEIIDLHKKIKPLEEKIFNLQNIHAGILAGLQERLNLTKSELQDTELQLKKADAKNFELVKEIVDLKAKLKKSQEQTTVDVTQNINDQDEQLKNQQLENRKLDRTNKSLRNQVSELKMCCTDVNTQCQDLQRQLQQSQEDADRLQEQLHRKDTALKQLQVDLEEQARENSRLQEENDNLRNKLRDVDEMTIYTSRMTLDPSTAHPRLVLSAGDTEITTTDVVQGIQDHPGRFNVVLAVLGATGFSAGRHYWEVSVKGKTCFHIGMASESAPRKGALSFQPANGFWTIILNRQGQYRALNGMSVSIPLQTPPVKLGILLDYKKGKISFYDADTRSQIYSFSGQHFTDKIYPFINFCVDNSNPIVLLSPPSTDWLN